MGVSLDGINSSTFDLQVVTSAMPLLAGTNLSQEYVIGKDGGYTFDNGFQDKRISLSFIHYKTTIDIRRPNARRIAKWLNDAKVLKMDYDTVEYHIKQVSIVDESIHNSYDSFTVTFTVDPQCYSYLNVLNVSWNNIGTTWDNADIRWDGGATDVKTFVNPYEGQVIQLQNNGNYKALPSIQFLGHSSRVRLEWNGLYVYLNDITSDCEIDCKNQVVYSTVAGVKVNKRMDMVGSYLELEEGTTDITITGGTNLIINFDFKDTFL